MAKQHVLPMPEVEEEKIDSGAITLPKVFYTLFIEPIEWKQDGWNLTAYVSRVLVASVIGNPWLKIYGDTVRLRSFSGDRYVRIRTEGQGLLVRGDKEGKKLKFEKIIQMHLRQEFARFFQPEHTSKSQKAIRTLK